MHLYLPGLILPAIAIVTVLTGLLSFLRPKSVRGFNGLEASGPRATTEIRAILGGTFIGMGLAGPVYGRYGYKSLGLTYLIIALTRGYSMIVDRSYASSNVISLVIEILLGGVLLFLA